MYLKVFLIDDEALAINNLEIYLGQIGGIEVVGKYTNPLFAFKELEKAEVDVVFLDMEMGEMHGLQFATKLMASFPQVDIIFVTAHPQYALEAFEVNAIDYLMKPINLERLTQAIDKAREKKKLYDSAKQKIDYKKHLLVVRSFGAFCLFDSQQNEVKWRTKKGKELFALLFHHDGKAVHRARIMDELWPELSEDAGVTLLHTTVYQVRRMFKEMGFSQSITFLNKQYALSVEVESDVAQFKSLLKSTQVKPASIKKILELYKGKYMEGEDYQWALYEQANLNRSFLNYLKQYISSQTEEPSDYIVERCLEKMTELEPYNEKYMGLLLRHYSVTNQTRKMIVSFQEFKGKWAKEIGLELPGEIVGLYKQGLINE